MLAQLARSNGENAYAELLAELLTLHTLQEQCSMILRAGM
jgi:hypothetical protein